MSGLSSPESEKPPYAREPRDSEKAHTVHLQAEATRESDDLSHSLAFFDEAIGEYRTDNNVAGIAEALLGKSISLVHLADISDREGHLAKAREAIEESERLTGEHNIVHLRHLLPSRFGALTIEEEKYADAAKYFTTALAMAEASSDGIKGNYLYHLGYAEFKLGNREEGIAKLEEGRRMITSNPTGIPARTLRTWESGAVLRLADCRIDEGKLDEAGILLTEAQGIIEINPILPIRVRQHAKYQKRLENAQK